MYKKMENNPEYFGFLVKEWMDKRNRRVKLMPYFGDNIFGNIRSLVWFILAWRVYSRQGMILFQ